MPYRGLLLLLPLYAGLAVLLGWHWSGYQLDRYLAAERAAAAGIAATAALPLEAKMAAMIRLATDLAAKPDVAASLDTVNLFRRHGETPGAQSTDHAACDTARGAALAPILQSAVQQHGLAAIAVLDAFGDCQAASQALAQRSLFGSRSSHAGMALAMGDGQARLHLVRDAGKSRPSGFALAVESRDMAGRPRGTVAVYLDRSRINALLPLATERTASIAFASAEDRNVLAGNLQQGMALLRFAMRGVSGYDILPQDGGWGLHVAHRLGGSAVAVHATLPVQPIMHRLMYFCLAALGVLVLPALYLIVAIGGRRKRRPAAPVPVTQTN